MMTISIVGDGYTACLKIDSIVDNTSSGGVRIAEEVSHEEVAALAREMTLKYALYRLPRGGAKTGVSIPGQVSRKEKTRILNELGRKLGPIIRTGVYYPGMDMNCGPDDLRAIYAGAGLPVGRMTDTSYFTAMSVESALKAWYDELGRQGAVTVAVEGFGRVAGHLAARLPSDRYKIVAISTLSGAIRNRDGFNLRFLAAKRNEVGDDVVKHVPGEAIANEDLFAEPVDILIPSSRTWVIHHGNMEAIRAKVIVPIANAPYGEGAIGRLHQKGVLCLPGYVTNAGGVFGSSFHDMGLDVPAVERITNRYAQPVMRLLVNLSRRSGVSPTELAERAAARELDARNRAPAAHGKLTSVRRRLKRYLPVTVGRHLAQRKFVESLAALGRDLEIAASAGNGLTGVMQELPSPSGRGLG
jgi:glutamate dehydrogenase (NAD(P)+)